MKLRRVQLVGFKSFRDRVTVELSDGMNGIVGPNGCGKSNVVDAVKWAMGDMSPKSLRGAALSDVIFAGSQTSRGAGMAEVTLTFENDDKVEAEGEEDEVIWSDSIPREFREVAEISITRRLHKSGESEYLINDVACRLMDIRDLLAGTGLGKQGYSIIEQGEIAFVVSAKPSQRRLIIEEASGITRYKGQRDRSMRKLERTEQNLQRVRDVLGEVGKQLRALERQARRAEKFERLEKALRQAEIARVVEARAGLSARARRMREGLEGGRAGVAEVRRALEQLEEDVSAEKVAAFQAEKAHSQVTEEFYKLDTRLNLARSTQKHVEQSVADARERRAEAQATLRDQTSRRQRLAEELAEVESSLEAIVSSPEHEVEAAEQGEKHVAMKRASLREAKHARDDSRERLQRLRSGLEQARRRLDWAQAQRERLERRMASNKGEVVEARQEVEDSQRALNRVMIDIEAAREGLEEAEAARGRSRDALEAAQREAKEQRGEYEGIHARLLKVEARAASLKEIRERGDGYADGVREMLEWAARTEREGVIGPVGDFLQVEKGDEAAVAAFLGPRLSDVLVTQRRVALDALDFLRRGRQGRVGCVVLPEGRDAHDWVGGLLGDLEIVDGLDGQWAERGGAAPRATRAGDVDFGDGRLVGGHVGEQGESVLRQVRELRELGAQRDELSEAKAAVEEMLEVAEEDVATFEEQFNAAQARREEVAHTLRRLEQDEEAERRELKRARSRLERAEAAIEPVQASLDELDAEERGSAEDLEAAERQIPEAERALGQRQGEVEALEEELEGLQAELTARKVALAEQRERRRSLHQNRERLARAMEDAERYLEKLSQEIDEQQARIAEFQSRVEGASRELVELDGAHRDARRRAEEARAQLEHGNQRVMDLEVKLAETRKDLEAAQARVQSGQMALREVGLEIEHLDRDLRDRFDLTIQAAGEHAEGVGFAGPALERRIRELRAELEGMGKVNAMAVEEFEEAQAREAFLEEQEFDLVAAIDDLREAIQKMDRESRRRFKATFEAVDAKFRQIFPRLFRGGHARLMLTDPDDLLDSGVDIEVSPPGKKLQNINLLSGGEKALTAVSLIFAIFMLKPTPFSVLDEVDAPLDEANVGRFAAMVKELSQMSQMIVITHNRRTMEDCEMLYGVTMEEAGVSKIVSVKVDELSERFAS